MTSAPPSEPRRLGGLLLVAIIAVPAIFCWFTLRRGYRTSLRIAVFIYAIVMTSVGVVGRLAT